MLIGLCKINPVMFTMDLRKSHTFGTVLLLSLTLMFPDLSEACPFLCDCSNYKVNCYDKMLKEIPRDFPEGTIAIDLQYNGIESIGDQFQNLTSVREIMLRFNSISNLSDGAFSDMPNLKHVNLGSNMITNVSSNTFQNVPQMSILDLTDNQLTNIDGSFKGLFTLTKLVLTRNRIEELTEDSLQTLTGLIYFMADENQISYIHPDAFKSLYELSFVSLSKNPLTTVDHILFLNIRLSYLNLEHCQLQNVPEGLPWTTRNLQLRGNNITKISKDTFLETRFLGIIVLDENNISEIEPGAFTPIAHLQQIFLNGNQLSSLPTPIPATVHTVSIDSNKITTISHEDFLENSKMKFLSLRGNEIDSINPFTFSRLKSLQKLYISANSITHLQDKSFFGMRNLTVLEVGKNPITHIDVRFVAGLQHLDTLDLSYLDDSEPFVRGNFFRDVPFLKTLILRHSPSLTRHILNSNETLKSFYNLKNLDIRDNDLQILDIDLPRFFPNIQSIQLSGNAWLCDPALLWLHDWMQKLRDAFEDVDAVVCTSPMHLAGEIIADLPYHAFFYTTPSPTTTTTVTTTVEVQDTGSEETEFESSSTMKMTTNSWTGEEKSTKDDSLKAQTSQSSPTTVAPDLSTQSVSTNPDMLTSMMMATSTDSSTTEIPNTHPSSWTATANVMSSKATRRHTSSFSTQSTTLFTAVKSTLRKHTTASVTQPKTPKERVGESKHGDDPRQGGFSTTHTIIIASSVAVVALIVLIAVVLILRNRRRIELVFHHTLGPKAQNGDTDFVLNDQDDPDTRSISRQTYRLSESEPDSATVSTENGSTNNLNTRLI